MTKSQCIICDSKNEYFFSKEFDGKYTPDKNPLLVDYEKCTHCGFVLSTTHKNLESHYWEKLNLDWHTLWDSWDLDLDFNLTNRPPFTEQAIALKVLFKNGLITQLAMGSSQKLQKSTST